MVVFAIVEHKCLVVHVTLDPPASVLAHDVPASLVVDEDEDGERDGRQPPLPAHGVGPQHLAHPRAVRHEAGTQRLEHHAEVEHPVVHTLVSDGVVAGLADD